HICCLLSLSYTLPFLSHFAIISISYTIRFVFHIHKGSNTFRACVSHCSTDWFSALGFTLSKRFQCSGVLVLIDLHCPGFTLLSTCKFLDFTCNFTVQCCGTWIVKFLDDVFGLSMKWACSEFPIILGLHLNCDLTIINICHLELNEMKYTAYWKIVFLKILLD
ncbi:hypothetical protein Ancab_024987, partial [Ancistrocladus abbreviatus]